MFMISRYALPEMTKIWEDESKYSYWLKVELAVCIALNKMGKIPDADLKLIIENAAFSVERIEEIEKETKHDVIAFLTNLNENIGTSGRFVHMGLTSSDVLDTALSLQIKDANSILEKDILNVIETLKSKASEYKKTVMVGRSHGVHAEPITFGFKLCVWLDIFERNLKRFQFVQNEIKVGKISGAVGTYSNIDTDVEKLALSDLGLMPARISTQVIQRDIHADYIQTLAIIASTIEQFCTELRHLQRTEVLETEEGFSKGQKGSSAMPHKKNPIGSENLCGLARIIRANSIAALENIALWHERDISHSSVERVIFPDCTILLDFMLNRFNSILTNLNVYPENMKHNLNLFGGIVFSQKVLIKLCEKGLTREEAYKIVQSNAHSAWNNKDGNFRKNLLNDDTVGKFLTPNELDECFEIKDYLKNMDKIYSRFEL